METGPAISRSETSTADIVPQQKASAVQRLKQSLDVGSLLLLAAIAIGIYNFIDWSQIRTLDFGIIIKFWRPLATAAGMTIAITATAAIIQSRFGARWRLSTWARFG